MNPTTLGGWKALAKAEAARADQAERELELVDEVLARRPALDDEPRRWGKISKTIATAATADVLEQRVRTLEANSEHVIRQVDAQALRALVEARDQAQHGMLAQRGKIERGHAAFHELFPEARHTAEQDTEPAEYLKIIRATLDEARKQWQESVDREALGRRAIQALQIQVTELGTLADASRAREAALVAAIHREVPAFATRIAHGDEPHRAWLRAECDKLRAALAGGGN